MKLSRRMRWSVLAVLGLAYLSGVLWLVLHYGFAPPARFGPPRHPWEPGVLALHGLAAMAALVAVGSMLPLHARSGWRSGRNRWLGAVLLVLSGWAALSAWGLYYAADERLRNWLPVLHWLPLLLAPLVLGLHLRQGRVKQPDAVGKSRPGPVDRDWDSYRV